MRPNDAELAKVQASYGEIIGRVNRITPLYGLLELWQFRETGRKLDRILAGGDSLYVLDRGGARSCASSCRSWETARLRPIPRRSSARVKPWGMPRSASLSMPTGRAHRATSAAVCSQSILLPGWRATIRHGARPGCPLVARISSDLPQLIKSFGGNLYVVDTKNGQIWRYRPGDKGFEGPPEPYFAANTKVDLTGVQSIDIDGNVWLLFADGRLLKFYGGEQKPFELKGLPDPLSARPRSRRRPMAI